MKKKRTTIKVDTDILENVRELSDKYQLGLSDMLDIALSQFLEQYKRDGKIELRIREPKPD